MSLTIEAIHPDELPKLVSISCDTFYETFYEDNTPEDMELYLTTNFTNEKLGSELAHDDSAFFFAKKHGEPVGYVKANLHAPTIGFKAGEAIEISRLYVRRAYKGGGIGKALIEHVLQLAQLLGKRVVWLGVWEHNIKAIAFYKSLGFEKYQEHEFMLGADVQNDWLMKKELEPPVLTS